MTPVMESAEPYIDGDLTAQQMQDLDDDLVANGAHQLGEPTPWVPPNAEVALQYLMDYLMAEKMDTEVDTNSPWYPHLQACIAGHTAAGGA